MKTNPHSFTVSYSSTAVSNNSAYWPQQSEPVPELFTPVPNKEYGKKKPENGNGYRLFGIQLVDNSNVEETLPVTTISSGAGEDQPVVCLDADSDHQSQRSNINQSKTPTVGSDPEKSCLGSSLLQSRQIRSCTKVLVNFL